jgi:uncharacterized protein (TIGR00369 family)
MFWTLGGKQVGKAALAGWEYLRQVSVEELRYWPFEGSLEALLDGTPGTVVIAETYPREYYRHFRATPFVGSKRRRDDRLRWIPDLLQWADTLGVTWQPDVLARVEQGFSDDGNGEDEFDAVVGLLGMLGVVAGVLPSGEPLDDPPVLATEGWILGRPSTITRSPVTKDPMPAPNSGATGLGIAMDAMATLPNADKTRQHNEVLEQGGHLFQLLGTRDVPSPEGHLAIEMDVGPHVANVRGALQGGLIAVLVDVCAGRLAYDTCDHENGYSTATSDMTIHFLSPVAVGPARAEAWMVRQGRSSFVLQVEVTDVGRDDKLAAVSTIAFMVLPPRT